MSGIPLALKFKCLVYLKSAGLYSGWTNFSSISKSSWGNLKNINIVIFYIIKLYAYLCILMCMYKYIYMLAGLTELAEIFFETHGDNKG